MFESIKAFFARLSGKLHQAEEELEQKIQLKEAKKEAANTPVAPDGVVVAVQPVVEPTKPVEAQITPAKKTPAKKKAVVKAPAKATPAKAPAKAAPAKKAAPKRVKK